MLIVPHRVVDSEITEDYATYCVDNVEGIRGIPDKSVGLIVTSPPFPGMYAYSNSPRDIGNCDDMSQMLEHFRFLAGRDGLCVCSSRAGRAASTLFS